jgi:hypothetical protein
MRSYFIRPKSYFPNHVAFDDSHSLMSSSRQ